jgi:hypothetical protein
MRFLVEPLIGGITALIVFLGIFSPLIIALLIYYFKKRLEHKQIMAAIEKGMPLSELRPVKKPAPAGPLWIKNLTAGIAFLVIAGAIILLRLFYVLRLAGRAGFGDTIFFLFVAAIFLALGISHLLRGILQRKTLSQTQPSNGNNTAIENTTAVSNAPVLQQQADE